MHYRCYLFKYELSPEGIIRVIKYIHKLYLPVIYTGYIYRLLGTIYTYYCIYYLNCIYYIYYTQLL